MSARGHTAESGSALVEAAIVIPCLVLVIVGSAALTDALALKLRSSEALRYAIWETTVFKLPRQIDRELRQRFPSWRVELDTEGSDAALGTMAAGLKLNPRGVAQARLARFSRPPLRLVFDTWKAWPKPAPYTLTGASTDLRTSPGRTYPEVEKQVSAQVSAIAFLGASGVPGLRDLDSLLARVFRLGITEAVAGGSLPDILATGRMDDRGSHRGPITILPPERSERSWVPNRCEMAGKDVPCPSHRAGDVTGTGPPRLIDDQHGIGEGVDRTRYTLPYRIHSAVWRQPGGVDRELQSPRLEPAPPQLAGENGYVKSYRCRGHFFGGSRTAQRPNDFGSCG